MNVSNESVPISLLKLIFDKVFSAILILVFLPISLCIIIAIKINGVINRNDKGPIFYVEERMSQGEKFSLIKFRLFTLPAIKKIRSGAITKSVENEPGSLTRVGKFLKKWGLDELPQLINILKGDISIVGPRPKPEQEYLEELNMGVRSRELVKAGLTGPVQVMKGTKRTYEEELAADKEYVENCRNLSQWKLLLVDTRIILKTIKVMFKGTGE